MFEIREYISLENRSVTIEKRTDPATLGGYNFLP